jgi:hypothetical protein
VSRLVLKSNLALYNGRGHVVDRPMAERGNDILHGWLADGGEKDVKGDTFVGLNRRGCSGLTPCPDPKKELPSG